MTELSKLLTTLGYTDEEQRAVIPHIGTLRRLITTKKETLEANSDLSSGIIDEIMALKEWYIQWKNSAESEITSVEQAFTVPVWENFILRSTQDLSLIHI